MRHSILLTYWGWLLLLSLPLISQAQTTAWAYQVVEVSDQLENSAQYIIGKPDALLQNNDELAWYPRKENSNKQVFITVQFSGAIRARQVAVSEIRNPGAIHTITLIFENGSESLIYKNLFPRKIAASTRLFTHSFPLTDLKVEAIRLELNTAAIEGYNAIDAIGISNTLEKISLEGKLDPTRLGVLGVGVNTAAHDFAPVISKNGKKLFFIRQGHPQNMGGTDVWLSYRREDDTWSHAIHLGIPINNRKDNQVIGTNEEGTKLFLKLGSEPIYNNHLFSSFLMGRSWSKPKKINPNLPTNKIIKDFHFTQDGEVLLVAIESLAKGYELAVTEKIAGKWSPLMYLGKVINTPDDERSVFLTDDKQTLYFSSNGHGGMGGTDMFMARRTGPNWTDWTVPVNFGIEFNDYTDNDDFSFTKNGTSAFFSKKNEQEEADIFQLPLPEELLGGEQAKQKRIISSLLLQDSTLASLPDFTVQVKGPTLLNSPGEISLRLEQVSERLATLKAEEVEMDLKNTNTISLPQKLKKGATFIALRKQYIQLKKKGKYLKDDNELAEMKSRFNAASEEKENPDKSDLEAMKRRFNAYHAQDKSTEEEDDYMDLHISNGVVYDEAYDVKKYGHNFKALQKRMWKTMYVQLLPVVKSKIRNQVYPFVQKEILREMMPLLESEQQKQLALVLRATKKQIAQRESQLDQQLISLSHIPLNELTEQLRTKMEPLISKEIYKTYRTHEFSKLKKEVELAFLTVTSSQQKEAQVASSKSSTPVETWTPKGELFEWEGEKRIEDFLEPNSLKELYVNDKVYLSPFLFQDHSAIFHQYDLQQIATLVTFLTVHPSISIEIGVLFADKNRDLALQQAEAIKEALVVEGIAEKRLSFEAVHSQKFMDKERRYVRLTIKKLFD